MEATENRNRTSTHNDAALLGLTGMLKSLSRIEVYYQFCNNSGCREITLLVLPVNRRVTPNEVAVFSQIVRTAGIPGIILEYPNQSAAAVRMHAITRTDVIVKDVTWAHITSIMASRQQVHETNSKDRECARYDHAPQPRGTWKAAGENYRFSNEARTVPGVRHLDTDAVMYCNGCSTPIFVVEATSDGCPNTRLADRRKNTTMTRKVADILGAEALLIQHEVGVRGLMNDAYLTTYAYEEYQQARFTWADLADLMETSGSCACAQQAA